MLSRCLASALCLLWLSACVPIPPGHQSKMTDVDFLKVGSTKKTEVVERLGAPSYALDAGKFVVCDEFAEHWVWWLLPLPYNTSYGPTSKRELHYHLVCVFDDSGVLTEYEISIDNRCRRYSIGTEAEAKCQLSRLSTPLPNRPA